MPFVYYCPIIGILVGGHNKEQWTQFLKLFPDDHTTNVLNIGTQNTVCENRFKSLILQHCDYYTSKSLNFRAKSTLFVAAVLVFFW